MATAHARPNRRPNKAIVWTASLIRRLRGKRTQAEFARLLGATKNTVWRWEAGRVVPDPASGAHLARLAEREGFHAEWKLVGSIRIVGDMEAGSRELSRAIGEAISRSIRELDE